MTEGTLTRLQELATDLRSAQNTPALLPGAIAKLDGIINDMSPKPAPTPKPADKAAPTPAPKAADAPAKSAPAVIAKPAAKHHR